MPIIQILRAWKKRFIKYVPLVEVEISKSALLHNYNFYKEKSGRVVVPVLKSNAYGHGLFEVASVMEKADTPFLVVDSLYEAIFLRRMQVKKPILVIGYTSPENIAQAHVHNVAFTITSMQQLQVLIVCVRRKTLIHLKVDTGMHRQGIAPSEVEEVLTQIRTTPKLVLEGVCSHFGSSDELGHARTKNQKEIWMKVLEQVNARYPVIKYKHISATSGVEQVTWEEGNLIRLGIGLYGIDPTDQYTNQLQPVLSLYAPITGIRKIKKGEFVGYGDSFEARHDMVIALLPLGYFEGIDRRLSGVGMVMVGNAMCPIIGRVSMNMMIIDITQAPGTQVGSRVLVLGGLRAFSCSIELAANAADMIPYELLVHIPQHLRRTLV